MTASLTYSQPRSAGALGVICTRSFPAVVGTADMMLKSADVTLVGYEKTGSGFCTAVIRGGYADIKLALEAGVATARQFEQYISSTILPRPQGNLEAVLPISRRLSEEAMATQSSHQNVGAIGLIETNGFPALVGAADAMLKSANVKLICYEKTGSGLCTAIVQGTVSNVTVAVEAGMYAAERIGQLNAIMVIPRPLDDLMESLPEPQSDSDAQPLQLPLRVREKQPLLELPELERQPIAIEAPRLLAESQQSAMEFAPETPIPEPLELPDPRTDQ